MQYSLFLDPQDPGILPPHLSAGVGYNAVFTLRTQRYSELTLPELCVQSLLERYHIRNQFPTTKCLWKSLRMYCASTLHPFYLQMLQTQSAKQQDLSGWNPFRFAVMNIRSYLQLLTVKWPVKLFIYIHKHTYLVY